jgi:tRNA uridine 5-carboxymethylaminomethyl modification enzyme
LSLTPTEAGRHGLDINRDGRRRTAFELLSYPDMSVERLKTVWPELANLEPHLVAQLETDARYASYVRRQDLDVEALKKDEAIAIPDGFDYTTLASLKAEVRQKLELHRPATLAQAGRIEGMTPAALMLLLATVKKLSHGQSRRKQAS